MQRFTSPEQAQRFLVTFSAICNHVRPRRHRLSAGHYRDITRMRLLQWHDAVCVLTTH
jgi:putative transposase